MNEKTPGVNAWLPPTYGPKRRYEPPTCERGERYVGHALTFADRLAVAGFVVPRMRAGSMPRVVHVGTAGRTVTGEQLGAALLRRVDIEADAVRPPTVCPMCLGKKEIASAMCRRCRRSGIRTTCACGRRKTRGSEKCKTCFQPPERARIACACGRKMSVDSTICRKCWHARAKAARICACGGKKSALAGVCKPCADAKRRGEPTPAPTGARDAARGAC